MAGKQYGSGNKGKSSAARTPATGSRTSSSSGSKFVDRNLMGVSPMKEQFEPTDSQPVPQRYKMGGGC